MLGKIFKIILFVIEGLLVLVFIITSFIRSQGAKQYARYDSYTKNVLAENFDLKPYPIKTEFQTIHPWKALKLLKFVVESQQGERLARINTIDATMMLFMKMYTLLLRPNYGYNLPMLSMDFIFIGGKRVFVIEVIDPARIDDANKQKYYDQMRVWQPQLAAFEPMEVNMDWCKDIVTDFSVHIKADSTKDDVLFEIYKTFLDAYVEMAKNAQPLSPAMSAQVKEGMEGYVSALLAKGGPAVDVFKKILGPEKQQEYIRTVMFGVE